MGQLGSVPNFLVWRGHRTVSYQTMPYLLPTYPLLPKSGSRPGYYLTSWFMDGVLRGPVRYGTPVLAVHTVPYGVPRYDTIKLILRGNYPTSEGDHRVHMQTSSEVHHHPSWAPISTLSD
ncbi:predicted protein [Aspergillus terreus NIH2624]|uniref:Uncharacterized protein n=1 Tax=Aspergillus terreus (strain NIH 2624 / FGSC A1156) TaxID=341663 RepID=Q0CLX8_ASPTN|nr:uncharacterized protein ATEG_05306 [Aspergillus terreus NIH2624]EAU34375.1 predicted protein [Aspergillus terreus NIH2624]